MLEKDIYVTGTIQSNRRGLPADMKTKLKNKGDIVACRKGSLLGINWLDRKQVRLLSTASTAKMIETERYDGSTKRIPKVVAEYNHGMGGVDLSDQMTDCYAAEFRTVKCWKKVVFHLVTPTIVTILTIVIFMHNCHNFAHNCHYRAQLSHRYAQLSQTVLNCPKRQTHNCHKLAQLS
jgi:hypothetical protein